MLKGLRVGINLNSPCLALLKGFNFFCIGRKLWISTERNFNNQIAKSYGLKTFYELWKTVFQKF